MQQLHYLLKRVAISDEDCLLLGKTGTGKELAAHAIHSESLRSKSPFVAVNCSALSENLLESELFGHTRGAFTGAVKDKVGRFELAHKGTIFLDEIGEVSPRIQVKLLRVLQERQIERVGEARLRDIDVRIVAATNRNLYKMVQEGKFREDLYYRLKVFSITLPSLVERRQDIPILVEHFLNKYQKANQKKMKISSTALKVLLEHNWPGNVRELENAIRYALVLCQDQTILSRDLPVEILEPPKPEIPSFCLKPKLRSKESLIWALQQTGGNRKEAAQLLGISRVTLWKRMKHYDLLSRKKSSTFRPEKEVASLVRETVA